MFGSRVKRRKVGEEGSRSSESSSSTTEVPNFGLDDLDLEHSDVLPPSNSSSSQNSSRTRKNQPSNSTPVRGQICSNCERDQVFEWEGELVCYDCGTVNGSYKMQGDVDAAGLRNIEPSYRGDVVARGLGFTSFASAHRPTVSILYDRISKHAAHFHLSESEIAQVMELGKRFLSLKQPWRIAHGQSADSTAIVLLYITCRLNDKPVLLMDAAEIISTDLFFLGKLLKRILSRLNMTLPSLELFLICQKVISLTLKNEIPDISEILRTQINRDSFILLRALQSNMMMDGRKPEVMVAALLSIIFEVHHLYSEKIFGFIVTELHVGKSSVKTRENEIRKFLKNAAMKELPWGRSIRARNLSNFIPAVLNHFDCLWRAKQDRSRSQPSSKTTDLLPSEKNGKGKGELDVAQKESVDLWKGYEETDGESVDDEIEEEKLQRKNLSLDWCSPASYEKNVQQHNHKRELMDCARQNLRSLDLVSSTNHEPSCAFSPFQKKASQKLKQSKITTEEYFEISRKLLEDQIIQEQGEMKDSTMFLIKNTTPADIEDFIRSEEEIKVYEQIASHLKETPHSKESEEETSTNDKKRKREQKAGNEKGQQPPLETQKGDECQEKIDFTEIGVDVGDYEVVVEDGEPENIGGYVSAWDSSGTE